MQANASDLQKKLNVFPFHPLQKDLTREWKDTKRRLTRRCNFCDRVEARCFNLTLRPCISCKEMAGKLGVKEVGENCCNLFYLLQNREREMCNYDNMYSNNYNKLCPIFFLSPYF